MGPHPPLQYCRWTFWQQDSIYLATIKVIVFLEPWTQQMDFLAKLKNILEWTFVFHTAHLNRFQVLTGVRFRSLHGKHLRNWAMDVQIRRQPPKNKLRKQNSYSLYKTQLRLANYISMSYLGTNKRKVMARNRPHAWSNAGLGSDHYMVSTYATELWMSKSEDNPQKTGYENKTAIVFIKHGCDWLTIYRCHILEQIRGKFWHRTGHMHGAMQGEGISFSFQGTLYSLFNPYAKSTNKKLN